MATNSAGSTCNVATAPTSCPSKAATVASSALPIATTQQLQPILQPRASQALQHHPQRHNLFQPLQHASMTNQQHHQPGLYTAPTTFQTQTHMHPHLAKSSESIRYPLASSGRGLLPAPRGIMAEQLVDSSAYPPMPSSIVPNTCAPQQYQLQHLHSRLPASLDSSRSSHLVRGPFLHPSHAHVSSVAISAAARGAPLNNHPLFKAGSSPYSAADCNTAKDPINKGTDDTLVTIRDRKVRISDGASFYALCRSWLRNGYVEEKQPQYGDVLKSLPKPLPLPESFSPKRKERDDETEVDEADNQIEISDAAELLAMHVKRAKRVRARLREERAQRIDRYKSRLALLLPPNGTIHE